MVGHVPAEHQASFGMELDAEEHFHVGGRYDAIVHFGGEFAVVR